MMQMKDMLSPPREKITSSLLWYVFVFVLGWESCLGYYQVKHLWTQRDTLQKQVVVEHTVAATAVAQRERVSDVLTATTGIQETSVVPHPVKVPPKPKL